MCYTKTMKKIRIPLCLTLFSILSAKAQYIQVNDSYTAQQLVNALVDNSCAQVSNIALTGSPDQKSHGYFTNPSPAFPLMNGIVLSTGYATSAKGPNNSLLSEGSSAWAGDLDLEAALGVGGTINATILEFDFIPFTDRISFDYIFASEQYLTSITSQNQCNYTDGFAFLIKEAGSTTPYKNLAVVPGTDTPVKVNTVRGTGVCPAANEEYFGGFNPTDYPVNFNGQTAVLQATTDVIPGTAYHIKLVVADQGNNLYDSAIFLGGGSFKNITNLGPDRIFDNQNPLCAGDTVTLDATTTNATGYTWFRNGIQQPENTATYSTDTEGNYSVIVNFGNNCTSTGEIKIEVSSPPQPANHTLLQCDEGSNGLTSFNLELANSMLTNGNQALTIEFYLSLNDASNRTNRIANSSNFQNTSTGQTIYVRITNPYGCHSISTLTLQTTANGLTPPAPIALCDDDGTDDGFTAFDLTIRNAEILQDLPAGLQLRYFTSAYDALLYQNPITDDQNFVNTAIYNQVIFARVYNASECYGIVPLELIVYSFRGSLDNEKVILCNGSDVTLDAGNSFSSYEWNTTPAQNTSSITVDQPGTYTVNITSANGCEGSKTFIVSLSGKAEGADISVNNFRGKNNSAMITPVGPGDYEFSIDGKKYQESGYFTNLSPNRYTVYIRDKNNCGIYPKEFYVLDYPRYFTPNGDGIDDTWKIPYLSFVTEAEVIIYDRYGKVITGFKGSGSWDGTLKGQMLPSTDYWFTIKINSEIIKGHFAMIR